VMAAHKPVFIDKPVAGSLADALEIYQLAKQYNVPCFSSSSLRFGPGLQELLKDPKRGDIKGCAAFSPYHLEEHHPDLYWYGIHGVEILYTAMGNGCKTVARTHGEEAEVVVGVWGDGRVGSFRGLSYKGAGYGAMVFGSKGVLSHTKFEGYEPLVVEICKFFKTGVAPVSPETTIEICAFMQAADESKAQGGCPVSVEKVLEKAKAEVAKRNGGK
jgi:predicted dehydrogenase